jgi:hypothetical protein
MNESLRIRKKAYGLDHPIVAFSYNNIGQLYKEQGRFDESERFMKECQEILKKSLGEGHPSLATCYNNIG